MKKDHKKSGLLSVLTVLLFLLAVYMLATQWLLPDYYQKEAEASVKDLVRQAGIETFSCPEAGKITDKVYFAAEVFILADWDKKQREIIQKTLGTEEAPARLPGGSFAPPTMEYYLWQEKQKERPKREEKLREAVEQGINNLYDRAGEHAPVRKMTLLKYYKWSGFEVVWQTMELVRKIADQNSYDPALFVLLADTVRSGIGDRCVPADLLYSFWPEGFRQCCNAYLAEQVQKENLDTLTTAVARVDAFEKRYETSVELSGYVRDVKSSLERKNQAEELKAANEEFKARPSIPEVGMTYEKARNTKLGAPTRTNKTEHYSSAAKRTYYNGNMYWDLNGRQIFRAEFKSSVITNVWDTRWSNSGSKKTYQVHSGKSGKSDAYDVHDYNDPDDFADEWAEEFGDGDYDGGWDDAWDYWQDNH